MKIRLQIILCLLCFQSVGYSQTNPLPGFGSMPGFINKLEVFGDTNMDRFLRFSNGGNSPIGFAGIQFSSFGDYTWFTYSGTGGELIFSQAIGNPGLKGLLGHARFVITPQGNVGIGTSVPSNFQGWGKVVEIKGGEHAKLLVSSEVNDVRVGVYAHYNWHGPRGIIGTETDHDLSFITSGINEQIRIKTNGNVGIGTITPSNKLEVNGTIKTKEVNVTTAGWPDYVFASGYDLMSLDSLQNFVNHYNHLPEVPSEKSVLENGVNVGEMNAILLKKIEELTLYLFKLDEELKIVKASNKIIMDELQYKQERSNNNE